MGALRRLLDWLFGSGGNASGVPPTDDFDFTESLVQGESSPATQHAPPPGFAVLEAYAADGDVVLVERIEAPRCAPTGSRSGYTRVIVPAGAEERSHQYTEIDLGPEPAPFPLPEHLSAKHPDRLRIWWSCHAE